MTITTQITPSFGSNIPSDFHANTATLPTKKIWSPSVAVLDDAFKQQVHNNDPVAIDCLFTLACEPGPVGKEAETFLFNLYTGREPSGAMIPHDLERDCLRFYEMVTARNALQPDHLAWPIPEKILLIAGFAAEPNSPLRDSIAGQLNRQLPHLPIYLDIDEIIPKPITGTFFAPNRLITHTEVNLATHHNHTHSEDSQFLEAQAISPQWVNTRTLPARLINSLKEISPSRPKGNFMPLLFRDHWVLFGVSESSQGHRNAVLFDSANYLKDNEKHYLLELSNQLGADNLHFIEQNIQSNLPNACGLLVIRAQDHLAKYDYAQPNEILSDFSETFLHISPPKQDIFNRQGRAEIYGNVVDLIKEMYYS